jgi:hypothetical protein
VKFLSSNSLTPEATFEKFGDNYNGDYLSNFIVAG